MSLANSKSALANSKTALAISKTLTTGSQPTIPDAIALAPDIEKMGQLEEAFAAFNQATRTFESYYQQLENRIDALNLELEEKNHELEANLQEKEKVQNYLAMILETISAGVVVVDRQGNVQTINRAAREIFTLEDIVNVPISLSQLLPDLSQCPEIAEGAAAGFCVPRRFEWRRLTHKNESQWLDVQIVPPDFGDPSASLSPNIVINDITEIKSLARQANLNSRLKAMGEVAMNIAHEVRNPLGSIELFSSMLARELSNQPELQQAAGHILNGVKNIDSIVSNILAFARNSQISAQDIDPAELIANVLEYLESPLAEKSISVAKRLRSNGHQLLGDPDLLKQAFSNIVQNAIQAMNEDGCLELTAVPLPHAVEFQIIDDGCGISDEHAKNIYHAFFTTRRKGTGLGLAIAHRIVTAHQGKLAHSRRKTGGTIFTITLPLKQ